jgi:ATP-dependent DNA helicase RecQ
LIAWRRERARADGVPAYIVADNKTLAAIAAHRPISEGDLLGIPGIGRRKAETYGPDLLRVLADGQ